MKNTLKVVLAVVPMLHLASASAQEMDMDEVMIDVRQSLMGLQVWNIAPLGAMTRGNMPFDADLAAKNGERIAQLAGMISDAFARNTAGSGHETEALDGIWEAKEEFDAKAQNLVEAATAYAEAARAGEAEAKRAFGKVGGACGGCHEDFRESDD